MICMFTVGLCCRTRGRGMVKEEAVDDELYGHSHGYSSTTPKTFDYNHGLPVKEEPMDVGGQEAEEGRVYSKAKISY